MIMTFVAKFYENIIAFLLFLVMVLFIICSFQYYKLENIELNHQAYIQDIENKNLIAIHNKNIELNQVGKDYEIEKQVLKEKQNVIYRKVEKIIERPVYLNVCIDDDGLSEINSSIKDYNPPQSFNAMSTIAFTGKYRLKRKAKMGNFYYKSI